MNQKLGFFQSLDRTDGLKTAEQLLTHFSPCFLGTIGLSGRPQIRPGHFLFEQEGALYFITVKSSLLYGELSKKPYVQSCIYDPETKTLCRISGKACFTEDTKILERSLQTLPDIGEALDGKEFRIAYYLTEGQLELTSQSAEIPDLKLALPDPSGIITGIHIKKITELRDRLTRIFIRREENPPVQDPKTLRLYDGALFVFAEAAKALWPRMDIQPVERAAVFETWDEREKYMKKAAALIGNTNIQKPEDLTYWLDPETLKELSGII